MSQGPIIQPTFVGQHTTSPGWMSWWTWPSRPHLRGVIAVQGMALGVPVVPEEKQHKVRVMFGNGLRPQIWEKFVTRFNIPDIAEFYGATEGNSNILNIDNKIGAVGYLNVTFPSFITQR